MEGKGNICNILNHKDLKIHILRAQGRLSKKVPGKKSVI